MNTNRKSICSHPSLAVCRDENLSMHETIGLVHFGARVGLHVMMMMCVHRCMHRAIFQKQISIFPHSHRGVRRIFDVIISSFTFKLN
jgi:hypothetical protein